MSAAAAMLMSGPLGGQERSFERMTKVRTALLDTAAHRPAGGRDDNVGNGVLDVNAALRSLGWDPEKHWRNSRITTDCGEVSHTPFDVDLRDGAGVGAGHFEIRVISVATGDLTAGPQPDTAVMLYCHPSPSNYFRTEVQVFGPDRRRLAVLHPPDLHPDGVLSPEFSEDTFAIDKRTLHTSGDYYTLGDCHAGGPTLRHALDWTWNGGGFDVEAGGSTKGPGRPCVDPETLQETLTPESTASGLFRAWRNRDRAAATKFALTQTIDAFFTYDPSQHDPDVYVPTCEPSGIPQATNCNFGFITMVIPNAPPGHFRVSAVHATTTDTCGSLLLRPQGVET